MPASKPAPPTGITTSIDIGDLFDDLDSDRALPGNDRRIVVAVDVGKASFFRDLVGVRFSLAEIFPVQDDRRAEFLAIVHFD